MATPITTKDVLVTAGSLFCTLQGWGNIPNGTIMALNVEDQEDNVSLSLFYQPPGITDYFFDGPDFALYASENDVDYDGIVVSGGLQNDAMPGGSPTWSAADGGATWTNPSTQEQSVGVQAVNAGMAYVFSQSNVIGILQATNVEFMAQMVSRVQNYINSWLSGLTVQPYTPATAPTLYGTYPANSQFESGIEMVDASAFLLTLTPSAGAVTVGKTAVPPA